MPTEARTTTVHSRDDPRKRDLSPTLLLCLPLMARARWLDAAGAGGACRRRRLIHTRQRLRQTIDPRLGGTLSGNHEPTIGDAGSRCCRGRGPNAVVSQDSTPKRPLVPAAIIRISCCVLGAGSIALPRTPMPPALDTAVTSGG